MRPPESRSSWIIAEEAAKLRLGLEFPEVV